jgi:hypothetical protein
VLLLLPDYAEIGVGGVAFKRLLNDFREVTEDLKSTVEEASGISKDLEAGTVMKGNIRNVELRVETVQELLMGAMTSSAASTQGQLYDAGWNVGLGWSTDFMRIEEGVDVSSVEGRKQLLDDWSYYDASAGLGKFTFFVEGSSRFPSSVLVTNGFLSSQRQDVDLRIVLAGYIAGSLQGLLASNGELVTAELVESAGNRERYKVEAKRTEG